MYLSKFDHVSIRIAQEELSRIYSEAGASLYAQAGATPEAGAAPSADAPPADGAPKAEEVVEADYEIVDDKK